MSLDEGLVARARGGDREALDRVLGAAREGLRRRAARLLAGRLEQRLSASDIVQQTLLDAHQGFSAFRGRTPGELRAWLGQIVEHNVADALRDHLRLQKRAAGRERALDGSGDAARRLRERLAAPGSSPSRGVARQEERKALERALDALPVDQREALRLRHLEGLSLDEIAERLGKTPVAAASLIKRGLRRLRDELGGLP